MSECPNRPHHDYRVVDYQWVIKSDVPWFKLRNETRFVFQCTACTETTFVNTDKLDQFLREYVDGLGEVAGRAAHG